MSSPTGTVLFDYVAQEEDELSIFQGEVVQVLETYDDGWWLVANELDKGLVPSNYLSPTEGLNSMPLQPKIAEEPEIVSEKERTVRKDGIRKSQNDSEVSLSNDLSPAELKRLKAMREQAEMRISALRTAVSNYESETLTKKPVPVDQTHQQYPPQQQAHGRSNSDPHPSASPNKRNPTRQTQAETEQPQQQPQKQKATKKSHRGVSNNNSHRVIESSTTPRNPRPSLEPTITPTPPKIPQVALDQNSLNFISKIINERLEREFSVRDERIIDKVKSLLVGGTDDDGATKHAAYRKMRSESDGDNNRENVADGRVKSKIPRVVLPKVASASKSAGDVKAADERRQKQEKQPPSLQIEPPVLKTSNSAPTSSSSSNQKNNSSNNNRLPQLVKSPPPSQQQHQGHSDHDDIDTFNDEVLKGHLEQQQQEQRSPQEPRQRERERQQQQPLKKNKPQSEAILIDTENDHKKMPDKSRSSSVNNNDGEIHSVKEKRPPVSRVKSVVADEITKGIQYPQCRSVVYPPTDIEQALRNASDTPSAELVLQHIYGRNSASKLLVLGDNCIAFAAASAVVCMDPANRKQSFFLGHTGEVTATALHPNRGIVVSAGPVGKDTMILMWDSTVIQTLKDSASKSCDNDNQQRAVLQEFRVPHGVRSVSNLSFSGDGCFLSAVVVDTSHSLLIYEVVTGALAATSKVGLMDVADVRFNPYAYSTALSTEYDDTTLGCYTLVGYGGKQIKFWTLNVFVGSAAAVDVKQQSPRKRDQQQMSPRSESVPDVLTLRYSLDSSPALTCATAGAVSSSQDTAATSQPDITCMTFTDDSVELEDSEDGASYRQPEARVLVGTDTGSVVIWQQTARTKTLTSGEDDEDEQPTAAATATEEPEHFQWLPTGKILSVVTDVHDTALTDIAYFTSGHEQGTEQYLLYERILTSGADGTLNLWGVDRSNDPSTLPLEHIHGFELESKETVADIAWDRLGDCITVGTASQSVVNVSIANDEDVEAASITVSSEDILSCHNGKLKRIAVNPIVPSLFATICSDKTVRLWESTALRQVGVLRLPYNATAISFSTDGKSLAIGNVKGELHIYTSTEFSALMGQNKKKIHSMLGATIIALSLNNWVAGFKRNVAMQSSVVSPHKKNSKKGVAAGGGNKQCDVMEITYSPSGNLVAVGCKDSLIHLLNVENGYKHKAVCRGHSSFVRNIDFSVNGAVMQSTDAAREILFWDSNSGQQLTSAEDFRDVDWSTWSSVYGWPVIGVFNDETGHSAVDGDVHCVCRSSDRTLLVAGSSSHSSGSALKLFSYPCVENAVPSIYSGHTSSVADVAFLAGMRQDDATVVSVGSSDSCVFQWQVVKF